jgi:hypothetical protein
LEQKQINKERVALVDEMKNRFEQDLTAFITLYKLILNVQEHSAAAYRLRNTNIKDLIKSSLPLNISLYGPGFKFS